MREGRGKGESEQKDPVSQFRTSIPERLPITLPRQALEKIQVSAQSRLIAEKAVLLCDILKRRRKQEGIKIHEVEYRGVPLSATLLREELGDNGRETVGFAMGIGLIRVVKEYSVGRSCRRYWFSPEIRLDRTAKFILTKKNLIDHQVNWRAFRLKGDLKSLKKGSVENAGVVERMLLDLHKLEATESARQAIDRIVLGEDPDCGEWNVAKRTLQRLETGTGSWARVQKNGRISSFFTSTPSQVRNRIKFAGEPPVEWDMPASHPSILLSLFTPQERESAEFRMLLDLIQSRMFYQTFEVYWALHPDNTTGVKILFQKIINERRLTREDLPFFQELRNTAPIFVSKIVEGKAERRKDGKGAFSNYIQGIEAGIIIEVARRLHLENIPCYSVFDSIGVPRSSAEQARSTFDAVLAEKLNLPINVKTDGCLEGVCRPVIKVASENTPNVASLSEASAFSTRFHRGMAI